MCQSKMKNKPSKNMFPLFDMSEASVSTCSLISVTLHSLGLWEMSVSTENQGNEKSLQ